MAELDDGLILHLPLTESLQNGSIDKSSHRHEVHVRGRPKLLADPDLGAANRFSKKDSIHISALNLSASAAFTLQMWVRPVGNIESTGLILSLGNTGSKGFSLYSYPGERCGLEIYDQTGSAVSENIYDGLITSKLWSHLTFSYDGKSLTVWQNGNLIQNEDSFQGFTIPHIALTLIDLDFIGDLAQVRVYNRALSRDEINAQFATDHSLRSAYIESHPVILSLLDVNEVAAIYITDNPAGETLELELTNIAGRPVFLQALAGNPGPNNYHFELRFRPGTLPKNAIQPGPHQIMLDTNSDWKMSAPQINPNGTVSFYLIRSLEVDQSLQLDADRTLRIKLLNVRAEPATGSRASRLEMRYGNLHVGDQNNTLLNGSQISHFSILNHIGRQHLPLHVGFINGNTVIPGDKIKDNQLRLKLSNVSPELPIPWAPGNPVSDPTASYLEVSFDVELEHESKEWALTRLNESHNITMECVDNLLGPQIGVHIAERKQTLTSKGNHTVLQLDRTLSSKLREGQKVIYHHQPIENKSYVTAHVISIPGLPADAVVLDREINYQHGSVLFNATPTWKAIKSSGSGEPQRWKIYSEDATHLLAGDHIELLMKKIVTSLQPGHANLYIDYAHIPGYQPGRFVAEVEKSPVAVVNNNVGIGINNPVSRLQIGDGVHIKSDEMLVGAPNAEHVRITANYLEAKSRNPFSGSVSSDLRLQPNGGSVVIGPNEHMDQASIGLGNEINYSWIQAYGQKGRLFDYAPLKINPHGPHNVVIGNNSSYVGIGVDYPAAPLDVSGGHMVIRNNQISPPLSVENTLKQLNPGDLLVIVPQYNERGGASIDPIIRFYWYEQRRSNNQRIQVYRAELKGIPAFTIK